MTTLKKKSVREEVWLRTCGERFSHPCITKWCSNRITVFDFHVAHNIPSSRGGMNTFENLKPMCARCNYAMGNRYTIDEWQRVMSVSNFVQSDSTPCLESSESVESKAMQSVDPSDSVESKIKSKASAEPHDAIESKASIDPSDTLESKASIEPSDTLESKASIEPHDTIESKVSV